MRQFGSAVAATLLAAATLSCITRIPTPEEHAWEEPASMFDDGKIRLIFRHDDTGFCHASNMAFERAAEEGLVSAVSVIVNTPWFPEAAELLRQHPEVSVGVHLCLNAEWVNYRWGPVLPASEVPSLVDEWGLFYGMRSELREANPSLEEMERELRAQVDLALARGLNLSYIDHHMGTAGESPERRAMMERIANDYGIGISRWFGEDARVQMYSATPEMKADVLLEQIGAIEDPGVYLVVVHSGLDVPEMASLRDVHPWAPSPMAAYRQAETDAVCDPRLRTLIEERGMEIIGYDVIQERFLDRMRNPDWEVPEAPDDSEEPATMGN